MEWFPKDGWNDDDEEEEKGVFDSTALKKVDGKWKQFRSKKGI